MPVEVLAKRGSGCYSVRPFETGGPAGSRAPGTRPVGCGTITRRKTAQKTLYNLVGFQTNLRFPEQKRVFSMIPGLENAEFVRYGVMHRNTFIESVQNFWMLLIASAEDRQHLFCWTDDRCGGVY